ncbi:MULTISPECIES: hypothetical protein, partial [unclassified Caballeronia]|uniref:hypothetical protein n=1 Tax=unclassified Caballeronia TaxID=2646786 RepID=UPI002863BE78
DGHLPRERQAILRELTKPDVPELGPWFFYGFSHARPQLVITPIRDFSAFLFRAAAKTGLKHSSKACKKRVPLTCLRETYALLATLHFPPAFGAQLKSF